MHAPAQTTFLDLLRDFHGGLVPVIDDDLVREPIHGTDRDPAVARTAGGIRGRRDAYTVVDGGLVRAFPLRGILRQITPGYGGRPVAVQAGPDGLHVAEGWDDPDVIDAVVDRYLRMPRAPNPMAAGAGPVEVRVTRASVDALLAYHRRQVDATLAVEGEVPDRVANERYFGSELALVGVHAPARGMAMGA